MLSIKSIEGKAAQNRGRIMKKYLCLGIMVILSGCCSLALANEIFVSGNPGTLVINTAFAGSEPLPVTDASTTYSIDIFDSNMKITGSIDTAMPAKTSLKVTLTAPTGATSLGQITLTTTNQDLITGLQENMVESGLGISYEFSATVAAGIVSSGSKTVTFTVTSSL